jgi:hypothetical protein
MAIESEEQVRTRAFEIWKSEGCPNGRSLAHWHQAVNELGNDAGIPAAMAKTKVEAAKRAVRSTTTLKAQASRKSARSKSLPASAPTFQITMN